MTEEQARELCRENYARQMEAYHKPEAEKPLPDKAETPEDYSSFYQSITNSFVDARDITKALNGIQKELHILNETLKRWRKR